MKTGERDWYWSACGKHAAARDYFSLGKSFPLMSSFSDCIKRGYDDLSSDRRNAPDFSSWRLWAAEFSKDGLVCGLLRESSDGLGRRYPLLIMGRGPLKDWQLHWDFLPFACERTWSQLEYVSSRRFNNLMELDAGIQNIRPPSSEWPVFRAERDNSISTDETEGEPDFPSPAELEEQATVFYEKEEGFIRLDGRQFHDQTVMISYWHSVLRRHSGEMPKSMFMGGSQEETFLVFFKRPLVINDFVQLLSVSFTEQ